GYTALVEIEALSAVATWDIMYSLSYVLLGTAMINGIMVESINRSRSPPAELKTGSKSAAMPS
ncbi:MAG TPA: hypothetical protein VJ742_05155, partial [Nitrososphaera sp.]|nr:hypothetical protein [Nitrososphaera sp.]